MSAIVLLSGGLDSAVNLKQAVLECGVAAALTFDYGQRAAAREAAASAHMCRELDVPHLLIELPWLAEACPGALVDPTAPLPKVTPEQLTEEAVTSGETAKSVWVPNRNGLFVNIAAVFAVARGADLIVAGFNAEEAATFPDNSADFVAAANTALALSASAAVRLHSYTQDLTKADIVRLGRQIDAPLSYIWSCYAGGGDHCGSCESCARLERGLRQAGAWEWFNVQHILP